MDLLRPICLSSVSVRLRWNLCGRHFPLRKRGAINRGRAGCCKDLLQCHLIQIYIYECKTDNSGRIKENLFSGNIELRAEILLHAFFRIFFSRIHETITIQYYFRFFPLLFVIVRTCMNNGVIIFIIEFERTRNYQLIY